jgi:hypothetical protein
LRILSKICAGPLLLPGDLELRRFQNRTERRFYPIQSATVIECKVICRQYARLAMLYVARSTFVFPSVPSSPSNHDFSGEISSDFLGSIENYKTRTNHVQPAKAYPKYTNFWERDNPGRGLDAGRAILSTIAGH